MHQGGRFTSQFNTKTNFSLLDSFKDDEFTAMLKAGQRMEFWYGHWFDLTVINEDLGDAFKDVVRAITRLDQDAQWVPGSWVQ